MTQKETNLRSILFLVIGVLLLLSLVICIYIVSGERDLIKTSAEVVEVKSAEDGGVIITYDVDGQPYRYGYGQGEYKTGDKVTIYYHEKNPSLVQKFKTNKMIFIFPVIGLALCILGLFELFKKNDDDEEEYETSVIGVVGNTQQLKIVTDDTEVKTYEPTPEEVAEAPVKAVVKEEVTSTVVESSEVDETASLLDSISVEKSSEQVIPVSSRKIASGQQIVSEIADAPSISSSNPDSTSVNVAVTPVTTEAVSNVKSQKVETNSSISKMEDAIIQKVKNDSSGATINEDDIKKVIKDVLKEVIQEVKEEPVKPVVQKRVLPNYYYIAGTSLIYEEAGKEPQEIELKSVKSIVRTVNKAGNVVKLVVSNEAVKCVLTNMKNIDLEQLASLLNNKMRTIDDSFKEEIEYKEY